MTRQNETWRNSAYLENHDPDDEGDFTPGVVFVGMAFDLPSNLSDTYQAIKRSCKKLKLDARRVDDEAGSGPIPNRILRAIEDAEFLIFDLTVERPNVYYELGYAHGVGNRPLDILLIAKTDTKIHFDVAQLSIVFYDSATDLEKKLPSHLKRMITDTRHVPASGVR
jgi:hypothetical protein